MSGKDSEQKPRIPDFRTAGYREYLRALFAHQKRVQPNFSHQYCAIRLKTSRSYLKHILEGRRNLGFEKIAAVGKLFKLSEIENHYFSILVMRDLLPEGMTRSYFDTVLRGLDYLFDENLGTSPYSPKEGPRITGLNAHWFPLVLLEMMSFPDFKFDEAWIRGRLVGGEELTSEEISDAMRMLVNHGYVKHENGEYRKIEAPEWENMNPFAPEQAALLAGNHLRATDVYRQIDRYRIARLDAATIGVDNDGEQRMIDAARRFREEIKRIAEESNAQRIPKDRVVCLSTALFGVSR